MSLLIPVDSRLYKGKTQRLEHEAKDANGNVIDLTGLTGTDILWRLAESKGGINVLEKSIGSGITITNAAGGLFEVFIETTDSNSLEADKVYYWETYLSIDVDSVLVAIGYIQVKQPIQ